MYHSAMKEEYDSNFELLMYKKNGNLVCCQDITKPFTPTLMTALTNVDLVYSEPAWQRGYKTFLKRAGSKDSTFNEYLEGINNVIAMFEGYPIVLVLGKHMLRKIKPQKAIPLKKGLNGGDCVLGLWNIDIPKVKDTEELLHYLAKEYNCVYDFSAGYGNTAEIFMEYGKNFICSDFNKKCVFQMAKAYMGYAQ